MRAFLKRSGSEWREKGIHPWMTNVDDACRIVFTELGASEGLSIPLNPRLDSLDTRLPGLRETCRALRQYCCSW